jgi:hypothetical protein
MGMLDAFGRNEFEGIGGSGLGAPKGGFTYKGKPAPYSSYAHLDPANRELQGAISDVVKKRSLAGKIFNRLPARRSPLDKFQRIDLKFAKALAKEANETVRAIQTLRGKTALVDIAQLLQLFQ